MTITIGTANTDQRAYLLGWELGALAILNREALGSAGIDSSIGHRAYLAALGDDCTVAGFDAHARGEAFRGFGAALYCSAYALATPARTMRAMRAPADLLDTFEAGGMNAPAIGRALAALQGYERDGDLWPALYWAAVDREARCRYPHTPEGVFR